MATTSFNTNLLIDDQKYVLPFHELYAEARGILQKVSDAALALFREIRYGLKMVPIVFLGTGRTYPLCDHVVQWKKESKGLFVLVHGLKGHPSIWENHVSDLEKQKDIDLFVPHVPLRCNATCEEMSQPILEKIKGYIKQNPGKPICLIGVSNGARICCWLETQLREEAKGTAVKVSTVAGVHFGSSRMNLLARFKWANLITKYHPDTVKEISYGNPKAQALLKKVKEPSLESPRDYEFYASTEDFQVPDIGSSLPDVGSHPCKRVIVQGYGHNSIVEGIRDKQLKSCMGWMQSIH